MRSSCSNKFLFYCFVSVSCVALAATGCGRNKATIAQVHGKVVLDGKPLANGTIVTRPQAGRGSQGIIANGEFELGTFGRDDGALIGTHAVAVIAEEKGQGGPEGKAGKLLVPQRYTNPDTSGLTIEVVAGDNSPELKLTSP